MTSEHTGTIGILGVGHLARHLVPTLAEKFGAGKILLSPRGADSSQQLSEKYEIAIAADNADLVARSQTVLVSVRPFQVADALSGAPWRDDHRIVSLCAGVATDRMKPHTGPAGLVRAMPVTAGLYGESPTCLYPDVPWARAVLECLGPVIALASEDQFEAASVIATYYGWVQALIDTVAAKTADAGIGEDEARLLVSQMTRAAATIARNDTGRSLADLVEDLCLPGSMTGHGLEVLRQRNAFDPWEAAFDAVLEKMRSDQD